MDRLPARLMELVSGRAGRALRPVEGSAVVALRIACANDFDAGGPFRSFAKASARTGLARMALAVSANRGRTALGTGMVATMSSLSVGSRSAK
jgi:hypothetical protein